MTHEELIEKYLENKASIDRLNAETQKLEDDNRKIMAEYTAEHRKFYKGEMVHYLQEKYKVPRKYFIKSHFTCIEHNNDGSYECKIVYGIATENGHQPNGGWPIEEKNLAKY